MSDGISDSYQGGMFLDKPDRDVSNEAITDEEFVRKHGICNVHALPLGKTLFWGYADGHHRRDWEFEDEDEAWAAAAEFTRERLEQIRQVEEEIEWLASIEDDVTPNDIFNGIMMREQAARSALKKGMK